MSLPPFVIFGPSGVGKGTLIKCLIREFPNSFCFSISRTAIFPSSSAHDLIHNTHPYLQRYYSCPTSWRKRWEGISLHNNRQLQALDCRVRIHRKRSILNIDAQVPPIHFTFESYLDSKSSPGCPTSQEMYISWVWIVLQFHHP